jgi:hypothetical protein
MPRDPKRYKLLHGPYAAPRCHVGGVLSCQFRRRLRKVSGLTDAPVIWPFSQEHGPRSLILCGALVQAVRCESVSAVVAHWGVSRNTVWRWRRALDVPGRNEGTRRLDRDTIPEKVNPESLAAARERSRSPEARAKMSATRKGRPPHPRFKAAAAAAARRSKTTSFKEKTSRRVRQEWAEGKRRPPVAGPRWNAAEIARLGTAPDEVVGEQVGRSAAAVQKVRLRLAIPCFVPGKEPVGV